MAEESALAGGFPSMRLFVGHWKSEEFGEHWAVSAVHASLLLILEPLSADCDLPVIQEK